MASYLSVVSHEERRGAVHPVKLVREEFDPGVVAEEVDLPVDPLQLEDQVVLLQDGRPEVEDDVDEAGNGSAHHRLERVIDEQ